MGQMVASGAMMMCSFGVAPSTLNVLPANKVMAGAPAANIMDYKPMVNIAPFGMCTTPSNPTVAAATAAALGVLTPMPCVPNVVAPWMPGVSTVMLAGMPALDNSCKCLCIWGGQISIAQAGTTTQNV